MFGETVIRIRAGAPTGEHDRYGAPILGPDVETPLEGAAFDPGGSREPVEVGRAAVITTPRVFFPEQWPDVVSTDRLRVRGVEYRVTGRPPEWRDPFGSDVGGLVVELEAVEG